MFILALSLDWFTTIPGILISLGVVLLIVALILFITGSKGTKKEKVESDIDNTKEANGSETIAVTQVTSTQPVVEDKTQPEVSETVQDIPTVQPAVVEDNTVVETNTLPEVEVKPVEEAKLDQTMVSVYGEEKPSEVEIPVVEEKKPTIYGGNDPLEATQKLPKMEEHHVPYGGAINDIKIVEPVQEPIVEIPKIEETKPVATETEETQQQPFTFEIPAAPVEIPDTSSQEVSETPEVKPVEKVSKPQVEEL